MLRLSIYGLLLLTYSSVFGQDYYIKQTQSKIILDGILDEADWQTAEVAGHFHQYFPTDSVEAMTNTEVRLTYDEEFLYIGAKMSSPKPRGKRYVTPSLRRDYRGEANDGITIVLDPFQDNTNALQFGVNPFGVQREGTISNGGTDQMSLSLFWDNKWYAEAKIYEDYWVAEFAIPFKTLRFTEGSTEWNINFYRIDSEYGERSTWAHIPRQFSVIALAFLGKLHWDKPLGKPGSNIVVIPYGLARHAKSTFDTIYTDNVADAGVDFKVALTPSLNMDVTVNPDFSQVEVDQQVTNLDRFEIFFPERRQFFLENADLFSNFGTRTINPFFSRRIGVAIDENTGQNIQNRIYGGVRISGKLNDDWRIGLLSMQAAEDKTIGLPSINYSVAAFQRQVFERSNISGIFVNKQSFGTSDGNGAVSIANRVAGLDYNLLSVNNKWSGKLFLHSSFDQITKDPKLAGGAIINYNTRRLEVVVRNTAVQENYNPEVGFVRRTDIRRSSGNVIYKWYPNSNIVNVHGLGLDYDVTGNRTYGVTDYDLNILYGIEFRNTSSFDLRLRREYTYLFEAFDPTNTEGLELQADTDYTAHLVMAMYNSDARKRVSTMLSTRLGEYFNGNRFEIEGQLNLRLQPYGILSLDFTYNNIRLPEPYSQADLWLLGPKLDLTLTKSLFFTTFIQYNNQIENININSRFQWRFAPVSDLFLVYTENYFPDDFLSKNRALVLKVNYWLNL